MNHDAISNLQQQIDRQQSAINGERRIADDLRNRIEALEDTANYLRDLTRRVTAIEDRLAGKENDR